MLRSSASTVGSLFDLIKSTPSHQENYDHAARKIRSGAPSLVSKSPGSIASFNSSSRYQPSSCSTYSASAPAAPCSSPQIFKRQYIHQAIRLVDDALTEQDKGSCCDESYALDCYLGSLEYLLSAISSETSLNRQIGSADRQAMVHAKLNSLLRKTEEFSSLRDSQEDLLAPKGSPNGWWNGILKRPALSKERSVNIGPAFSSAPTDLATQCSCGRKVLVKIPDGMLSNSQQVAEPPEAHKVGVKNDKYLIIRLYEFTVAIVFTTTCFIKATVIPHLMTFLLTSFLSTIVYLEKRFQIVNLLLGMAIGVIKILLKIFQDYHFNQQLGNLASWLISHLVKVALAFVKREDLTHLTQLFDLGTYAHEPSNPREGNDGIKRTGSDSTIVHNFFGAQAPAAYQPSLRVTGGSSSSSSRFSTLSKSTYPFDQAKPSGSNPLRNGTSNGLYCRANSYRF